MQELTAMICRIRAFASEYCEVSGIRFNGQLSGSGYAINASYFSYVWANFLGVKLLSFSCGRIKW